MNPVPIERLKLDFSNILAERFPDTVLQTTQALYAVTFLQSQVLFFFDADNLYTRGETCLLDNSLLL